METKTVAKDIIFVTYKLLHDDVENETYSRFLSDRLIKLLPNFDLWDVFVHPVWRDVRFCISLIPNKNWWYHWSHLEFEATPTSSEYPIYNPALYLRSGRKISFSTSLPNDSGMLNTDKLCLGILNTYCKYLLALHRINEAKAINIPRHINTGKGPIIVYPNGEFDTIPFGLCFNKDGTFKKQKPNGPAVEIMKYIPEEFR